MIIKIVNNITKHDRLIPLTLLIYNIYLDISNNNIATPNIFFKAIIVRKAILEITKLYI